MARQAKELIMSDLVRFTVSIEKSLFDQLEKQVADAEEKLAKAEGDDFAAVRSSLPRLGRATYTRTASFHR